MSLRHRLFIFGVPALLFLGLIASCDTAAHADTGSTMWVKDKVFPATVVIYDKGPGASPRYVVSEIDAPKYADHIRAQLGTYGRKASVRLVNKQLGPSYKLTLGRATLTGCNVKVPQCSGDDDSVKQAVTMHWWTGHPGWKTATLDKYHRVRVIQLNVVRWFLETCGTNC